MPSFKSRDDDVRGMLSLKTRFGFKSSSRVKHSVENVDKPRRSDKQIADAIDKQRRMPDKIGADVVDANPLQEGKANTAVASGTTGTFTRLDDPASRFYTQSPPPFQQAPAQVSVDRFLPPAPRKTPSPQLRRPPPRTPPERSHVNLLDSEKTRSGSAASTASSATMTPTMYPRRPLAIDSRQMQQPRRPPPLSAPPPPMHPPSMNQNLNYTPPSGQGRTAGFPPSFSSSSSAATGNSSSPTAHSSDSIETPPSLEPADPSTKSSDEFAPPKPPEEFVAPNRTPGIDPTRASPPFNHFHGSGGRDPHAPGYFGTMHASRAYPRPFKRLHSLEGLYFAQLSLNSRPPPEMVMHGPTSSQIRHLLPQVVQLECLERHSVMHKVHNAHHRIPCMACHTMGFHIASAPVSYNDDPVRWRFVCGWCSVRVCPGCKDQLAFRGNCLPSLLRAIEEKAAGPEAPPDLITPGQCNAPLEKGEVMEGGEGGPAVDLSEGHLPSGGVEVSTFEVRASSPTASRQTITQLGDVAPPPEKRVGEGTGGVRDVPTPRGTPTPPLQPRRQNAPRQLAQLADVASPPEKRFGEGTGGVRDVPTPRGTPTPPLQPRRQNAPRQLAQLGDVASPYEKRFGEGTGGARDVPTHRGTPTPPLQPRRQSAHRQLAQLGDVASPYEKRFGEGTGGVRDVPTPRGTPTPYLQPRRQNAPRQISAEQSRSHKREPVQLAAANRPPPRNMIHLSSPAASTASFHAAAAAASSQSLQLSTRTATPAPVLVPAPTPAPAQPDLEQSRPPRAHEPPPTTQVRLETDRASLAGSLRKKWRMSFLKKKK